jgi:hypothetical protein
VPVGGFVPTVPVFAKVPAGRRPTLYLTGRTRGASPGSGVPAGARPGSRRADRLGGAMKRTAASFVMLAGLGGCMSPGTDTSAQPKPFGQASFGKEVPGVAGPMNEPIPRRRPDADRQGEIRGHPGRLQGPGRQGRLGRQADGRVRPGVRRRGRRPRHRARRRRVRRRQLRPRRHGRRRHRRRDGGRHRQRGLRAGRVAVPAGDRPRRHPPGPRDGAAGRRRPRSGP